MKQIIEYHEPSTGKLQHICFKLTKRESLMFRNEHGEPKMIIKEYPHLKPIGVRLEGFGWTEKKDGYVNEVVFFEPSTFKHEYIDNVKINRL